MPSLAGQKFVYQRPWLYPKQEQAIFNPKDAAGNDARYSFIEAATKSGKTVGNIAWLFERSYLGEPNQNRWWVAPVHTQAMVAFQRMKDGIPSRLIQQIYEGLKIILLGNRTIWFKSADNPDTLYGEDVYDVVIDEASRIKREAFYAVRSTLTATRGHMRCIGNVKGKKNWFYECSRRAEMGEPNWGFYRIVAQDAVEAGVLVGDEIDGARRDLPEAVFRELYLAEASDDGGNPFGLDSIRKCIGQLSGKPPKVWGWDLAKHVNWSVGIALDEDNHVCRFERFQLPWELTIDRIKFLVKKTPALIDSTGVGDPIVEAVQKDCPNVEGYQFTSPSKQKLMEGLAVSIQSSAIQYPEGPIVMELEQFEYEYTRTGVKYSAPEGFHDDCVMSLALARHHQSHVRKPIVVSANTLKRFAQPRMQQRVSFR